MPAGAFRRPTGATPRLLDRRQTVPYRILYSGESLFNAYPTRRGTGRAGNDVVIYPVKPVIWDDASIVPYKPFFGLRQKFHVSLRANHIRPLQRFFDFHHTKTCTASGSSSAVRVLLTPNSSSPSSFPSYAGLPARGGRTACGGRSSA